jgi:hypothetical protein
MIQYTEYLRFRVSMKPKNRRRLAMLFKAHIKAEVNKL